MVAVQKRMSKIFPFLSCPWNVAVHLAGVKVQYERGRSETPTSLTPPGNEGGSGISVEVGTNLQAL